MIPGIREKPSSIFETEIVATLIPGGIDKAGNYKVSLSLFPHLATVVSGGNFRDHYYEIYHWYQYMRLFISNKLSVAFFDEALNPIQIPGPPIVLNPILSKFHQQLHTSELEKLSESIIDLWRNMFPPTVNVARWSHESIYNLLDTITQQVVKERLFAALDKCVFAIQDKISELATADMPVSERNALRVRYNSFIVNLKNLKRKYKNPQNEQILLSDPIFYDRSSELFISGFLRTLFQELKDLYNQHLAELQELRSRIEFDKDRKPDDLDRINDYLEFHKLFSIYSYHPRLLDLTGWIWHYNFQIPDLRKEDFKFLTEKNFYIQLRIDENLSDAIVSPGMEIFNEHLSSSFLKFVNSSTPAKEANAVKDRWLSFSKNVGFRRVLSYADCQNFLPGNRKDRSGSIATDTFNIDNEYGYIRPKDGSYEIYPYLLDRKKILQKIGDVVNRSITGNSDSKDNVTDYTKSPHAGTEYISTGITLAIHGLKKIIDKRIKENPAANQNDNEKLSRETLMDSKAVVYAYNLQHGYVVDVISYHPENGDIKCSSLCKRQEEYVLSDNRYSPIKPVNEGVVIDSLQLSNLNNLYVDEELFRWNDWHLTCPLPGVLEEDAPNAPLGIFVKAPQLPKVERLVPLRLGRIYAFGLRSSNIIGEAAKSIAELREERNPRVTDYQIRKFFTEDNTLLPFCRPIKYQRVDSINSPVIHTATPFKNEHIHKPACNYTSSDDRLADDKHEKNWVSGREGEDMYNLVIRSEYNIGSDGIGKLNHPGENSRRIIGPPASNLSFIMQHGVLDKLFNTTDMDKIRRLRQEILPMLVSKGTVSGIDDTEKCFTEGAPIKYLYDPLANGFTFIVDSIIGKIDCGYTKSDNNDRYWLDENNNNKRFYPITLKDSTANAFEIKLQPTDKHGCEIQLVQGNEKEILLGCNFAAKFMEMDSDGLFMDGIRKTNYTTLKATHAVQKPCLVIEKHYTDENNKLIPFGPDAEHVEGWFRNFTIITGNTFKDNVFCEKIAVSERKSSSNTVNLKLTFAQFPVLTARHYIFHACYIDTVCDKTAPEGYRLVKNEMTVSKDVTTKAESETEVTFENLICDFKNPRYRQATFWIEAVSRFKKYFQEDKTGGFSVNGYCHDLSEIRKADLQYDETSYEMHRKLYEIMVPENNIRREGAWIPIKSTKRPKVPSVDKIVPLIRWNGAGKSEGKITRSCDTFRIYFKDWYDTGFGERLAVVFLPAGNKDFSSANTLKINDDFTEQSVSQIITQFGMDPTAGPTVKIPTTGNNVLLHIFNEDVLGEIDRRNPEIIRGINISQFGTPPDPGIFPSLGNIKLDLSVALFDINFMSVDKLKSSSPESEKETVKDGKFFVDIQIKEEHLERHYFPFVRFAIARFQPSSIQPDGKDDYSHCLSSIVLTDFCQPLPRREIEIKKNAGSVNITFLKNNVYRRNEKNEVTNLMQIFGNHLEYPGLFNRDGGKYSESKVLSSDPKMDTTITIDCTKLDTNSENTIVISEYEDYPIGASAIEKGDPRSDFSKRLVFAYEININNLIPCTVA